jgi:hypothetical protein
MRSTMDHTPKTSVDTAWLNRHDHALERAQERIAAATQIMLHFTQEPGTIEAAKLQRVIDKLGAAAQEIRRAQMPW